jgi:hypothetical protein
MTDYSEARILDFDKAVTNRRRMNLLQEAKRLREQFREAAIEIFHSNALDGFVSSLDATDGR